MLQRNSSHPPSTKLCKKYCFKGTNIGGNFILQMAEKNNTFGGNAFRKNHELGTLFFFLNKKLISAAI